MRRGYPLQRRVAVLLSHDLGYCRRTLSGVLRFAGEHGDWRFRDGPPNAELLPALAKWRPDGIIAHVADSHLAAGLARIGCPVVSTTDTLVGSRIPFVDVDNQEAGREAARYFLSRGFRQCAYYGSRTARFSRHREAGFREVLETHGVPVDALHAEYLPKPAAADIWRSTSSRVEKWLLGLAKPAGVFCSNDLPGRRIAEACGHLGIRVPDEIAILGVDNDISECRLASPALSSIETPAERIGHEAARILSAMMEGRETPTRSVVFPPAYVVTRASTDCWACDNPIVQRALNFIREEVGTGLQVSAVADHLGVSRRQLERVFRRELRTTVLAAIHGAQADLVRNLLANTDLLVSEISERCGFSDTRRMLSVFRSNTQMSPTEFRNTIRP